MGKIRLIASDIDGTLLPFGQDALPERVRRALIRVMAAGTVFVPASGRLISAVPRDILDLPGLRYVITCNGASVTDLTAGVSIYEKRIPAPLAAELLRRLEAFDAYSCVYLPGEAHNRARLHPGIPVYYSSRVGFFSRNPHEDLPAFIEEKGEPAEKIFVAVFREEERERMRRALEDIPGILVTSSSRLNLEINHAEATKGHAMTWLADRLGIPPEETAAMGDNENDLAMLTCAGEAVVPANAPEKIRKIADIIVRDCRDSGVADYLEGLPEKAE